MSTHRHSSIGRLVRRLILERPEDVPDATGGLVRTWVEVGQVWAAVTPVGGGEAAAADQGGQRLSHRILLRWRDDVTAEMRFRSAARTFSVLTVVDPDDRRRVLDCLTLEEKP